MQHTVTALLIAVALATLGGCGQTGPLYMPPPEEAPAARPDASGEPVAQPPPGT